MKLAVEEAITALQRSPQAIQGDCHHRTSIFRDQAYFQYPVSKLDVPFPTCQELCTMIIDKGFKTRAAIFKTTHAHPLP